MALKVTADLALQKHKQDTTTWMDLECIVLSEISQSEKDIYHETSFICGI